MTGLLYLNGDLGGDVMSDGRETVGLFPTAMQISMLPEAAVLKKDLMREVQKIRKSTPNGRPDSWSSSVYTTLFTDDKLHENPAFQPLTDHILGEAKVFGETLGIDLDNFELAFKDCWFNIYGWKDGQEVHIHNNSIISGSYYLRIPEGASGLVVHSPVMECMYLPPQKETNPYNTGFDEIFVEEGLIVLFRSNLKHSVKSNTINKERIIISFNIITNKSNQYL